MRRPSGPRSRFSSSGLRPNWRAIWWTVSSSFIRAWPIFSVSSAVRVRDSIRRIACRSSSLRKNSTRASTRRTTDFCTSSGSAFQRGGPAWRCSSLRSDSSSCTCSATTSGFFTAAPPERRTRQATDRWAPPGPRARRRPARASTRGRGRGRSGGTRWRGADPDGPRSVPPAPAARAPPAADRAPEAIVSAAAIPGTRCRSCGPRAAPRRTPAASSARGRAPARGPRAAPPRARRSPPARRRIQSGRATAQGRSRRADARPPREHGQFPPSAPAADRPRPPGRRKVLRAAPAPARPARRARRAREAGPRSRTRSAAGSLLPRAASCGLRHEVVGRPGTGQRQLVAVPPEPRLRLARGGLEELRPPAAHQEGGVEQDAPAGGTRRRRAAAGIVRAARKLVEQRGGALAAPLDHLAREVALLLLAQQELGPGGPLRLAAGALRRPLQGARLVEEQAQAPFLPARQPLQQPVDPLALSSHVLQRALVAPEQGEELHREHGP